MTHEEATHVFYAALMYRLRPGVDVHSYNWCESIVYALEKVGLLKLETAEDNVKIAAAERLRGKLISPANMDGTVTNAAIRISLDGAYEIIDILDKSGFKITRESK